MQETIPTGPEPVEKQTLDAATVKRMKEAGFDRPPGVTVANWNQPQELNHTHNAICYAAAGGAKQRAIAEALHITEQTVSKVVNSDQGKLAIKRYQLQLFGKDAKKRYETLVHTAIDVAEEIMTTPTNKPETRARVAKDFMDRATGKPAQPLEVGGNMVRSLIELLDRGASRAPVAPGDSAIDITPSVAEAEEMRNPNEVENPDLSDNPNFAPDPVDDWCAENL
jgi:predicted transcriptional regulator